MGVAETLEEVPIDDIEQVLSDHLLLMIILIVGLIILYLFTRRIMHFVVRRTLEASAGEFEDGGVTAVELDKRARTLESLATSLTQPGRDPSVSVGRRMFIVSASSTA